mmetsp:Transcript_18376/g.45212  ORF Transcript_18376/g.45212 Transcript_18376/m.45212 type:complete len:203 (-) Transcript_18376:838-1446(-)
MSSRACTAPSPSSAGVTPSSSSPSSSLPVSSFSSSTSSFKRATDWARASHSSSLQTFARPLSGRPSHPSPRTLAADTSFTVPLSHSSSSSSSARTRPQHSRRHSSVPRFQTSPTSWPQSSSLPSSSTFKASASICPSRTPKSAASRAPTQSSSSTPPTRPLFSKPPWSPTSTLFPRSSTSATRRISLFTSWASGPPFPTPRT